MRRRLPQGVLIYTGDDFNFPELIAGDAQGYSHALLGIFDAIAPAASAALAAQARGDMEGFHGIFAPTVPLSRHLFKAPTRFYKTGIVFLAYLNGHQSHFVMVGGQQSARSLLHLVELFRLADAAGPARRPRTRRGARMAARARTIDGDRRMMRDLSPTPLALDQHRDGAEQWNLREAVDGLRAGTASAAIAPWRDKIAGMGLEGRRAHRRRRAARHRLLPRRHVPGADAAGAAARSTTTGAAIDEAAALGAECLVMVVGGLPPGSRDIAARARNGGATASPRCCLRARGRRAARHRAAASDVCRPTAPA